MNDNIKRKTKLEIDADKARSMNLVGASDYELRQAEARRYHGERIAYRAKMNSAWADRVEGGDA